VHKLTLVSTTEADGKELTLPFIPAVGTTLEVDGHAHRVARVKVSVRSKISPMGNTNPHNISLVLEAL